MSQVATVPSLKSVFKFPLAGREWQSRILIGSALSLGGFLIVPTLFIYGYLLRILRQAIAGEELTLPAWDDWGRLAGDGLRVLAIFLVYTLPGLVVIYGGMALYFISVFGFVAVAGQGQSNMPALAGFLPLVSMLIMFVALGLGMLLLFLGYIPLPVALAHYAARGELRAAFRVREWWPLLGANKLGYLIAWVVILGLSSLVSYATMVAYYTFILCIPALILAIPFGFYLLLVAAGLFGQAYRESAAILAARERGA